MEKKTGERILRKTVEEERKERGKRRVGKSIPSPQACGSHCISGHLGSASACVNLPQNMLVSKLIERTTGNMLLVMNSAQPHLGDWKTTLVKQVTTRFSWLLGPDRLPRTTEVRLAGPAAQTDWELPARSKSVQVRGSFQQP